MKKLYIIKAGSTFPSTAERFGDFDSWTMDGLGKINAETRVLDAEHGVKLPAALDCAGKEEDLGHHKERGI
jgi:GMP synthase (glutamine-hydrolysing)